MAKKLKAIVKLQLPAGKATPATVRRNFCRCAKKAGDRLGAFHESVASRAIELGFPP